jgi:hypothetical protein
MLINELRKLKGKAISGVQKRLIVQSWEVGLLPLSEILVTLRMNRHQFRHMSRCVGYYFRKIEMRQNTSSHDTTETINESELKTALEMVEKLKRYLDGFLGK